MYILCTYAACTRCYTHKHTRSHTHTHTHTHHRWDRAAFAAYDAQQRSLDWARGINRRFWVKGAAAHGAYEGLVPDPNGLPPFEAWEPTLWPDNATMNTSGTLEYWAQFFPIHLPSHLTM